MTAIAYAYIDLTNQIRQRIYSFSYVLFLLSTQNHLQKAIALRKPYNKNYTIELYCGTMLIIVTLLHLLETHCLVEFRYIIGSFVHYPHILGWCKDTLWFSGFNIKRISQWQFKYLLINIVDIAFNGFITPFNKVVGFIKSYGSRIHRLIQSANRGQTLWPQLKIS